MSIVDQLNSPGPLTASQEHYLKKELINLQLHKEFQKLSVTYNDVTGLRKFGPPFAPYDPSNPPLDYQESLQISMAYLDHYDMAFPFTRHFFNNFLITFPFISQYQRLSDQNNNEQFWVLKVQKFYEIWKSKKISNSNDRGELSKRKLALFKIIKFLLMLYNSALPTTTDEEYLLLNKAKDKNAFKKLSKILPIEELSLEDVINETHFYNGIEIGVVGVRTSKELKTIRSLNNSIQYLNFWSSSPKEDMMDKRYAKFFEFLIHIRIESTGEDYYIARRYSEFQKLHHLLFKKFAGKDLPKLPSKIKQNSEVDYSEENGENALSEDDDLFDDDIDSVLSDGSLSKMEKEFSDTLKLSAANAHVKKSLTLFTHMFGKDKLTKLVKPLRSPKGSFNDATNVKLPREKLRVALRGYLTQLIKLPMVRNDDIFLEFISKGKFLEITLPQEKMDINLRKKMDVFVMAQQLLFQKETIKTIKGLQLNIEILKKQLLEGPENQGFSPLFNELEQKPTIEELPTPLRSFVDLTKIEIASTLYELFVANDQAMEFFKILKKMHQFFPYKLVATILRFTNPMLVMKKLIDLFLIQPPTFSGNGKSLLQFIFTLILSDDVKHLNKEILTLRENTVKKHANYKILIDKIEEYIDNKDDNLVIAIKKNASRYNIDLVLSVVMNNNDLKLKVPDHILMEVLESYRMFKRLHKLHSDEVEVEPDQREMYNFITKKAELFTYLDDLFKAMIRKRDKDNMKDLWDEPELTRLIKELITIFFQPLIKIFTEADIYLYVPILRDFINDLIALVNSYQNNYSIILSGNNNVVIKFVDLLTKYQNYMYTFIRNLYISDKNSDENSRIFTKMVEWFNSFVVLLKYVKNERPDLMIDMNLLVANLIENGTVDSTKLMQEVNAIIDKIEAKRQLYQKILEEEPAPLQQEDRGTPNNKINTQWADIHKNLSTLINFNPDDLPIADSEMDELNMELINIQMKDKVNFIDKFNDEDFLTFTTQYEMNRQVGHIDDEIEFNDEEDGFDELDAETEIKKLLGDFAKVAYPALKTVKP